MHPTGTVFCTTVASIRHVEVADSPYVCRIVHEKAGACHFLPCRRYVRRHYPQAATTHPLHPVGLHAENTLHTAIGNAIKGGCDALKAHFKRFTGAHVRRKRSACDGRRPLRALEDHELHRTLANPGHNDTCTTDGALYFKRRVLHTVISRSAVVWGKPPVRDDTTPRHEPGTGRDQSRNTPLGG